MNETTSRPRRDLPYPVCSHCMIKLNDSSAILIGGTMGGVHDTTLIYSYTEDSWFPGPKLNYPRSGHACGIIRDSTLVSNKMLVVAGSKYTYVKKNIL